MEGKRGETKEIDKIKVKEEREKIGSTQKRNVRCTFLWREKGKNGVKKVERIKRQEVYNEGRLDG